jgi:hypothetical protein
MRRSRISTANAFGVAADFGGRRPPLQKKCSATRGKLGPGNKFRLSPRDSVEALKR